MMRARSGLVVLGLAIGACAELQPQQQSQPPAPSGKRGLGTTCADNRVNCAFDPSGQQVQPDTVMVGGTREIRRVFDKAPPPAVANPPLVALRHDNLRPVSYRWNLRLDVKNQAAPQPIDPTVACLFSNGTRPIVEMRHTALAVQPGQTVKVEFTGPAASIYVDRSDCRVIGPLQ